MTLSIDSTTSPFSDHDFSELAARTAGRVLGRNSAGYDAATAGYNLAALRRPDLVVLAADAADVVAAVQFAAERSMPVAVMSTGHHAARPIEGGMLIVTRALDHVNVDTEARRAQIGAGAVWADVLAKTLPVGLAPLHGSSPQVGVVGFSLGGGISPTFGRARGWAVDHVTALRVVVADGSLLEVSAHEHADLFWALRGGRSNIGIVTAIEVELFPVGTFTGGGLFFDGADAERVLEAYRVLTENAPDELTTSVALLRMPPLPGIPELLAGRFVVHLRVAFLGSVEAADDLLAGIRRAAPVRLDTVGELPYEQFASIHSDPVDPAPFTERTTFLRALDADAVQAVLAVAGPGADPGVEIVELRHLGGALSREVPSPGALTGDDAAFVLWTVAVGMPSERSDAIQNAEHIVEAMRPWSTGRQYLNFTPDVDGSPAENLFAPDALARLREIKHSVDPQNLFRLQQPLI
ncbi:FAD-dependent oxygenase [Subtercola sp. Z020]|uniref:FAD-binding oxidoreductase n=1 Tax=Subtercola sp. Z020 TaxID=2080582 RepID=UPI000CE7366E|nr:FAD-binding oxidoreductase [Subtercola sp. Z020]PPF77531.1 FAD-dependent oxygenase [Subtercola sp. Z020]